MPEPKYFIYGLVDPRNNELRYVGKSLTGWCRPRSHTQPSLMKVRTHKNNWLRQLVDQGQRPIIVVLETHDSSDSLNEAEQFYIAYFKTLGASLTNATLGGDGASGFKHSAELKARWSVARKGKKQPRELVEKRAAAIRGKPRPRHVVEAIRISKRGNAYRKGATNSEEHRAKLSASLKGNKNSAGRPISDETRAKIAASLRGRKLSPEHVAKLRAGYCRYAAAKKGSDNG